jgi:hypothetical protein
MLRRILVGTITAGLCGAVTLPSRAGMNDPGEVQQRMAERNKDDALVMKMKKKLGLSAEQETAVRQAMEERTQKMSALREEVRAKMNAIRDASEAGITAVLTSDQKMKYDALKKEMEAAALQERQQQGGRDPGNGGPGGPGGGRGGMGGGPGGGGGFPGGGF